MQQTEILISFRMTDRQIPLHQLAIGINLSDYFGKHCHSEDPSADGDEESLQ